MKMYFSLILLILFIAVNAYSALPPIRISVTTIPDLAGKQLKIDVLNSSGTLVKASIIKPDLVPTDNNGVISFLLSEPEWTDLAYEPEDLLRVTYGSPTGVVLMIEHVEVIVARQGLFGAKIDSGEMGTLPDKTFTYLTINSGNMIIGSVTSTEKLAIDGSIMTSGSLLPNNNYGIADQALSSTGTNSAPQWTYPNHYIGESYGGGIVFYIWDNGKHGLIAATSDIGQLSSNVGILEYFSIFEEGILAGKSNTALIIASIAKGAITTNFAAKACADYTVNAGGIIYGDWYLPSKDELLLLYAQKNIVGGFQTDSYWSSSMKPNYVNTDNLFYVNFTDGSFTDADWTSSHYVRAIRSF